MFSQATLLLALAASATAHMTLKYPIPYGKATLNSSPLAPGDFPCKQRSGVYDITEMNQWNAGETKTIAFTGSAVHGGGSCQFSITTDQKPTVQSQWKVIQSVVGGCPSNVTGNLPENPNGDGAATFPVTMPKNIPDGQYSFAWTWINKVGNREFYMNCAPIQVGGGAGTASTTSAAQALGALPDMFVANLPATECSTAENEDFNYPNPGQALIEGNGAHLGDTLTGSGCSKQNKLGAGSGQIGSPSAGTPSQPSSAPQASAKPTASAPSYQAPQPSKVPSNPGGGVFAPGASPASPAKPSPSAAQPTAANPPPKDNPNSTTPVNGACTPCTNDGAVVCIGTKQFGLCNRGCAVAQDLAAGMACSNGVVVAATKRHVHFPRGHLHRRLSAAHLL